MLGCSRPSTARANTSPITANWTRLLALQSTLAPRSSITVSPRSVGNMPAIAGRSMPGSIRSTNFDTAIRAPVLPAETTPADSPLATASTASHMLERRPVRSTWLGLASPDTASVVWRTVQIPASSG